MAIISDTTKIDKSFKFVSGKAYTTTSKGVDNEEAPSGFIIGASSIFSQDGAIPPVALLPADPLFPVSILTFYGDGIVTPRFKMTNDASSPLNKAWYASTDGSSLNQMRATRQGNWVPPSFGNYTIRIFLINGTSTTSPISPGNGIEIFFSDASAPLFDYKAGILTFETDPFIANPSYNGVQIGGYRYIGPVLSQIFDGGGNYTGGLSDFVVSGVGTSLAKFLNPSKTLDVSSPHAIGTTWITEYLPNVTSSAIIWSAMFQLPNGKIIAAGGDLHNETPVIAYSYGDGVWTLSDLSLILSTGVNSIRDVWALDNSYVFAIDAVGKVMLSSDGGASWAFMNSAASNYRSIWGSSISNIYAIGITGAIALSTNSGASFVAQTLVPSTSNDFYAIWGSAPNDIFAVGASGMIYHSVGAGSWSTQTSGVSDTLRGVFGFSSTDIYVCGGAKVLHSIGGVSPTWVNFSTGIGANFICNSIWGSYVGGIKRLYVGGYDTVTTNYNVYYSDGIASWVVQATFTGPATIGNHIAMNIYGGIEGVYFPYNNGIGTLHQNPTLSVHGNASLDGYLASTYLNTKELHVSNGSLFEATSKPAISINLIGNGKILDAASLTTRSNFSLFQERTSLFAMELAARGGIVYSYTFDDLSLPGWSRRLGTTNTNPAYGYHSVTSSVSIDGTILAPHAATIGGGFGDTSVKDSSIRCDPFLMPAVASGGFKLYYWYIIYDGAGGVSLTDNANNSMTVSVYNDTVDPNSVIATQTITPVSGINIFQQNNLVIPSSVAGDHISIKFRLNHTGAVASYMLFIDDLVVTNGDTIDGSLRIGNAITNSTGYAGQPALEMRSQFNSNTSSADGYITAHAGDLVLSAPASSKKTIMSIQNATSSRAFEVRSQDVGIGAALFRSGSTNYTIDVGVEPVSASLLAPAEYVSNGTFETGTLSGWSTAGTIAPINTTTAPHAGTRHAKLGNGSFSVQTSTLTQNVALPAVGTTTLSVWIRRNSQDGGYLSTNQYGLVKNTSGTTLITLFSSLAVTDGAYVNFTADLTPYNGTTVQLYFNINNSYYYSATYMYVDDVSILNTGGYPPTAFDGVIRLGNKISTNLTSNPRAQIDTIGNSLNLTAYNGDIKSNSNIQMNNSSYINFTNSLVPNPTGGYGKILTQRNIIRAWLKFTVVAQSLPANTPFGPYAVHDGFNCAFTGYAGNNYAAMSIQGGMDGVAYGVIAEGGRTYYNGLYRLLIVQHDHYDTHTGYFLIRAYDINAASYISWNGGEYTVSVYVVGL